MSDDINQKIGQFSKITADRLVYGRSLNHSSRRKRGGGLPLWLWPLLWLGFAIFLGQIYEPEAAASLTQLPDKALGELPAILDDIIKKASRE